MVVVVVVVHIVLFLIVVVVCVVLVLYCICSSICSCCSCWSMALTLLNSSFYLIACDCNSTGSLGDYCNIVTGQCMCKPKITGQACDVCQVIDNKICPGRGRGREPHM